MSSRIHLLNENLINKIAAGEVVERPASVVKELVENALDAGALKVTLELEAGGKRLIRVKDDGAGMGADDALLALERHATSKIRNERDLFAISSLGFRGEALASIPAVSKLMLRTRDAESELGSEVRAEGGVIRSVRKEAMTRGTTVEVRSLFYNLPARREFLKSVDTELGHITDLATKMALAYPEVAFELYHHGKCLLRAPSAKRLEDRAFELLGASLASKLIKVESESPLGEKGSLKVFGLVSPAELTFSTTRHLYLYINRRMVRDKILTHALLEAYRTLIPKTRYPAVILFLEMPAAAVDVNVHPTKLEVRFREPGKIHQAIFDLVQSAFRMKPQSLIPGLEPELDHKARVEQAMEKFISQRPSGSHAATTPSSPPVSVPERILAPSPAPMAQKPVVEEPGPAAPAPLAMAREREVFSGLRVIGQFHSNYLVLESEDCLVVIDQHAAHERVNFEKLKSRFQSNDLSQQILLFPQVIELSFQQGQILTRNLDLVRKIGFDIDLFGGESFVVKATPWLIQESEIGPLLSDLADELAEVGRSSSWEEKTDHILSVIACHSSVRAGQPLSEPEIRALLKEMDQAPYVDTCPHGRPTVWKLPLRELEKKFSR